MEFEEFQKINLVMPDESIYSFDQEEHNRLQDEKPWLANPNYFKKCKISVNALIKMLIHACLGKTNEVMGLLQGRYTKDSFIIFDVIQLNAEASETAVTLTPQAMAEFTQTIDSLEKIGRVQPIVGWYHSHPSYGCWLSGTDVATQELQQDAYQTFVAVVIDPIKTMSNQKIDLGAFRVYPRHYKPTHTDFNDSIIPAQKIKDFGAHHERYYSLEVSFFSNNIDQKIIEQLWNRYWGLRLSQDSLDQQGQFFQKGLNNIKDKCFIIAENPQMAHKQRLNDCKHYAEDYAGAILTEIIKKQLFK